VDKGNTGLTGRIEEIIASTVNDMGFDIVRVQLSGDHKRRLQIMAEPQDGRPMVVEDCADISRAVSALLDVEDPIGGAYDLEVSSPGLDRPLTRAKDYERFAGYEAKVEMTGPIDGQRRFRGRLLGLRDNVVQIAVEGETRDLPYEDIQRAKLVLTEELIAASKESQIQ